MPASSTRRSPVIGTSRCGRVGEVQHEHLVLGIRRAGERERGGFHLRPERPHAAAVVDEQPHGDRNVVAAEDRDGLTLPVLEDREGALIEIGDQVTAVVGHRGVQHDQACLGSEDGFGPRRPRREAAGAPPALGSSGSSPARRTRRELQPHHGVRRKLHVPALGEHVPVHASRGAKDRQRDTDRRRDVAERDPKQAEAEEAADADRPGIAVVNDVAVPVRIEMIVRDRACPATRGVTAPAQ